MCVRVCVCAEANPEKFNNRIKNKFFYTKVCVHVYVFVCVHVCVCVCVCVSLCHILYIRCTCTMYNVFAVCRCVQCAMCIYSSGQKKVNESTGTVE